MPLQYRAVRLTTLLFLRMFNAAFTSAFSLTPFAVSYKPRFLLLIVYFVLLIV